MIVVWKKYSSVPVVSNSEWTCTGVCTGQGDLIGDFVQGSRANTHAQFAAVHLIEHTHAKSRAVLINTRCTMNTHTNSIKPASQPSVWQVVPTMINKLKIFFFFFSLPSRPNLGHPAAVLSVGQMNWHQKKKRSLVTTLANWKAKILKKVQEKTRSKLVLGNQWNTLHKHTHCVSWLAQKTEKKKKKKNSFKDTQVFTGVVKCVATGKKWWLYGRSNNLPLTHKTAKTKEEEKKKKKKRTTLKHCCYPLFSTFFLVTITISEQNKSAARW